MKILGVDIGFKGALSFYENGNIDLYDMPVSMKNGRGELKADRIAQLIKKHQPDHVFIERAMLIPKSSKITYQKMGEQQGVFIGVCGAMGIEFTVIAPRSWKLSIGCPADKDKARELASKLFPDYAKDFSRKKDDGRAEASLIALYGLRQREHIEKNKKEIAWPPLN